MEVSGQLHVLIALDPGNYYVGGWMDPRADLYVLEDREISVACHDSNSGWSRP
jgi:hypothetical protein